MKAFIVGSLIALGLMISPASADTVNLTSRYICIKNCHGSMLLGHEAYVTQNGWDLNLLTEANEPVRARLELFSPNRLWIAAWGFGAVYSPDGGVIQFDNGTIWQRNFQRCPEIRHCHYRGHPGAY